MEDLKDVFEQFLADIDESADDERREVAEFAAARAQHLSTIVGLPGFEEAVRAERDAVALKAGISVVDAADEADQSFINLVQGALWFAATLLSRAA